MHNKVCFYRSESKNEWSRSNIGIDWMTSDFLERLENSPLLAKAFADPAFQKAASEMAKNPQQAMAKYSRERPDLVLALKEFAGLLGDQLSQMAKKEEEKKKKEAQVIPEDLPEHEKDLLKKVYSSRDVQVNAALLGIEFYIKIFNFLSFNTIRQLYKIKMFKSY